MRMSAWYLRQLLDKFNGQLPLAITSYNAGPHRVEKWVQKKSHLPLDEFIEEIPFTEARGYVKKVLKYYALYQKIYLGEHGIWAGNAIDGRVEDNINY